MKLKKATLTKRTKRLYIIWVIVNSLMLVMTTFTPLKESTGFIVGSFFIMFFFSIYIFCMAMKDEFDDKNRLG
ncbi:preprotein translocase, SecY subunit, secY [Pediococcus acidilactici]|nr:preprotein translocase, SecY subunit, secY [Pediococcus acidilactici]KAF0369426.1 preprotein translocase, SecY subunit, secY [Pediococcus acidilactici]KAF0419557.1 preprotein translocase, SecY subunit, secY [Pediococcus acidilactici]KAF0423886.1 preprotein translocase, SecY subunit, secY [Pediococcus acidilactici]KAF0475088.1 preprotein translocase, SecY subunit, secY [Pediococcus acidilactici]